MKTKKPAAIAAASPAIERFGRRADPSAVWMGACPPTTPVPITHRTYPPAQCLIRAGRPHRYGTCGPPIADHNLTSEIERNQYSAVLDQHYGLRFPRLRIATHSR
jgi:hypothetical protein